MDPTGADNSLIVHTRPPLPYVSAITGDIFPGKVILVKGVVQQGGSARRFSIDLCCGQLVQGDHLDDKALHFNPRFETSGSSWFSKPDHDIVLNALTNNRWGAEQRCSNVLEVGKPFSIRFLILRDYFKIAINGRHLCDFIHRISPIERIKLIYIDGAVDLEVVEFQGSNPTTTDQVDTPPSPSAPRSSFTDSEGKMEPISLTKPKVPLIQPISSGGGFCPPRELHLVFTPRMNASRFSIDLMAGDERLIHVRVDFPGTTEPKGAIVRNSTSKGQWQTEERSMGQFPFLAGITADLHIVAGRDHAKLRIDGAEFAHFTYRASGPKPELMDKVEVNGDLTIQKFEFN